MKLLNEQLWDDMIHEAWVHVHAQVSVQRIFPQGVTPMIHKLWELHADEMDGMK